jgi:hypothetical protein
VADRASASEIIFIMSELSKRHEIKIRGKDHTIVFLADPGDRRLIIRQESGSKKPEEICTIAISDPEELRDFFQGLRRILSSLGIRRLFHCDFGVGSFSKMAHRPSL